MTDTEQTPKKIHVLGLGSIGLLIAHSLMRLEKPPMVTLLLHRPGLIDKFNASKSIRIITKRTGESDKRSGYCLEVLEKDLQNSQPVWKQVGEQAHAKAADSSLVLDSGEEVIQDLVVACKGPATISAMQSVKHRITSKSTICLMQNGMGQVDELNEHIFTKPDERPAYVLGIIAHGIYLEDSFTAIHAGQGTVALGVMRDLKASTDTASPPSAETEHLLQTLVPAPGLGCSVYDYQELLQLQLEKLTVNCVLNPLTALLNVHNGQMLNNVSLSQVHHAMVCEISAVIQALPELQGAPDLKTRFSVDSLTERLTKMTELTATNSSSMREDVRNFKDTEIDYINGYIVRRGRELGVGVAANELIMRLIKGKTQADRIERDVS